MCDHPKKRHHLSEDFTRDKLHGDNCNVNQRFLVEDSTFLIIEILELNARLEEVIYCDVEPKY